LISKIGKPILDGWYISSQLIDLLIFKKKAQAKSNG